MPLGWYSDQVTTVTFVHAEFVIMTIVNPLESFGVTDPMGPFLITNILRQKALRKPFFQINKKNVTRFF